MVDLSNVSGQPSSQPPRTGSAGYRSGRAVERVAAVTASRYSPETQEEMRRLAAFLNSGQAFRQDVPPGFYFNALV